MDYIGIVKALRKALADYTANAGGQGGDPTVDKEQLIARIVELYGQYEKGKFYPDIDSCRRNSGLYH